jgi:putative glutamine amidotransferase
VYGVEPDRDAFEIDLVREAVRAGLPTLCICRGMQILNVAFGGTLHQHLPGMPGLLPHGVPLDGSESMHDVEVAEGTRLRAATGASRISCSSHHHQGVDLPGDGLRVSARSDDGLVEGLEPTGEGWAVAVQWHPEDTAAADPAQQGLFDELVRRAAHEARGNRGSLPDASPPSPYPHTGPIGGTGPQAGPTTRPQSGGRG